MDKGRAHSREASLRAVTSTDGVNAHGKSSYRAIRRVYVGYILVAYASVDTDLSRHAEEQDQFSRS
jgi:hypothetical protein